MKIKTLAAFLAAATLIAFVSCKWFQSKKMSTSPVIGKWKIDSIHMAHYSDLMGYLLLSGDSKDSIAPIYKFDKDSLFFITKKDTTVSPYEFSKTENVLTIKDSIPETYFFSKLNDSLISLTSKDSSIIFLKKK